MNSKKAPNPTDKHVGARVRMRRMMLGKSQEKLGDALGLTFQQVQKYEKGANRIGASRLDQIARILQVQVAWFFEGLPAIGVSAETLPEYCSPSIVAEVTATREGLELIKSFHSIGDAKLRRRFVALISQVAEGQIDG